MAIEVKADKDEKSTFWRDISINVLVAVITLFGTMLWNYYADQVQFLDYTVDSSGSLNNTIGELNVLRINDVELSNAGLITVSVFNKTDDDYDSLPIRIKLTNKTKPVSIDYVDVNGSKDRIKFVQVGQDYLFTVSPVNRGSNPILKATFIVEDVTSTACVIDVKQAGLEPRATNVGPENRNLEKEQFVRNILVVVMALSTILLVTVYRNGRRRQQINTLLLRHQEEMEKRSEELERAYIVSENEKEILLKELDVMKKSKKERGQM